MKIVIPGGSGQVGTIVARAFRGDGHDVVVLSRRPDARPWRVVRWDGATLGHWQREIDGCDVVINLTGHSVNCRYTAAHREEILQSRVLSTRVVGQAIAASTRQPRVWLQASTATIYAHRYDSPNDEHSGILGGNESSAPDSWRFSIDVARAWERAFEEAVTEQTRKVALRSAMTLSPDAGGVFDALLGLARYGLGGSAGHGRQFMSWIHYEDFIAAVRWLIERDTIAGVVNVAAPNPLPNAEFMRVLREACGVPFGLPAKKWMLEVGAVFMRTEPSDGGCPRQGVCRITWPTIAVALAGKNLLDHSRVLPVRNSVRRTPAGGCEPSETRSRGNGLVDCRVFPSNDCERGSTRSRPISVNEDYILHG